MSDAPIPSTADLLYQDRQNFDMPQFQLQQTPQIQAQFAPPAQSPVFNLPQTTWAPVAPQFQPAAFQPAAFQPSVMPMPATSFNFQGLSAFAAPQQPGTDIFGAPPPQAPAEQAPAPTIAETASFVPSAEIMAPETPIEERFIADPVRQAAERVATIAMPDYDPAKSDRMAMRGLDTPYGASKQQLIEERRSAMVERMMDPNMRRDDVAYRVKKDEYGDAYRSFWDLKTRATDRPSESHVLLTPESAQEVKEIIEPIVERRVQLQVEAIAAQQQEDNLRAVAVGDSPAEAEAAREVIVGQNVERTKTYLEAALNANSGAKSTYDRMEDLRKLQEFRKTNPADAELPKELVQYKDMTAEQIGIELSSNVANANPDLGDILRGAALYETLPAGVQRTLLGDGTKPAGWSDIRNAAMQLKQDALVADLAARSGLDASYVKQLFDDKLSELGGFRKIAGTVDTARPASVSGELGAAFDPVVGTMKQVLASRMMVNAGVTYENGRVSYIDRGWEAGRAEDLKDLSARLFSVGRPTEAAAVDAAVMKYSPRFAHLSSDKYDPVLANETRQTAAMAKHVLSKYSDGFEADIKSYIGVKLLEANSEHESALSEYAAADPSDTRATARFESRMRMIDAKFNGDIDLFVRQNARGVAKGGFLRDELNNGERPWNVENMMMAGTLLLAFYAPFERREAERRQEKREDERYDEDWERQKEAWAIQNGYRLQQIGAAGEASRGGGGSVAAVRPARF